VLRVVRGSQSLDTNLVLTSAIGKMAVHPHPAVRSYLFALSSSSSLYRPLSQVPLPYYSFLFSPLFIKYYLSCTHFFTAVQVAERAEKRCEELGLLGSYQDALSLLRTRMLGGPEPTPNHTANGRTTTTSPNTPHASPKSENGERTKSEEQQRQQEDESEEAEARRRGEQVLATPHVEKFLQALLLLQEFQKEVAAIMHASALVGHASINSDGESVASP
jgi:hypothetical protein